MSLVKTIQGVPVANIKAIQGVAIAEAKTFNSVEIDTTTTFSIGDNLTYHNPANHNCSLRIDDTHALLVWSGSESDGYAQVFEVDMAGEITALGTAFEFDMSNNTHNSLSQIDDNHFILFYAGVGEDGFTLVLAVDLDTWAVSAPASALEFDAVRGQYNSCQKIDESHYINFWTQSNGVAGGDSYVQVFEVNLSTWEVTPLGSALLYANSAGIWPDSLKVDENHFILFSGSINIINANTTARVFEVNLSTWAVTAAGNVLQFDDRSIFHCSLFIAQSGNSWKAVDFWRKTSDGDGYARIFEVNLSTLAISALGPGIIEFDTTDMNFPSGAVISNNELILTWGRSGFALAQIFQFDLSGNELSQIDSPTVVATGTANYASFALLRADIGVNFFREGVGSTGIAQVFEFE